jgi:hypothetical protein
MTKDSSSEERKDEEGGNSSSEENESGELERQDNIACEGKMLKLTCEKNQEIIIESAFYGRRSVSICKHSAMKNTSCEARGLLEAVRRLCQNKSNCELQASNNIVGDPCSGTNKYLQVNYKCTGAATRQGKKS